MVEDVAADLSLLFTAVHPTGVVQNHPNRNSSSSLDYMQPNWTEFVIRLRLSETTAEFKLKMGNK
jgi:hypothetical protein